MRDSAVCRAFIPDVRTPRLPRPSCAGRPKSRILLFFDAQQDPSSFLAQNGSFKELVRAFPNLKPKVHFASDVDWEKELKNFRRQELAARNEERRLGGSSSQGATPGQPLGSIRARQTSLSAHLGTPASGCESSSKASSRRGDQGQRLVLDADLVEADGTSLSGELSR